MHPEYTFGRRDLLKASAALTGLAAVPAAAAIAAPANAGLPAEPRAANAISPSKEKLTIERRGAILLIGINRPEIANRIDPETYLGLAHALYQYDQDDALRAAILFGHGEHFSRGIDVAGFAPIITAGHPFVAADEPGTRDPLEKVSPTRLSKPLIAVVHGDTWNMAHEIFLTSDIRIAAADTAFGQDESTHGRFPGGGSTVRFVREAGWSNAMRYMLTGDHWGAEEAYRMGLVQHIANDANAALESGLSFAEKIAKCAPLGIKTTLASAHLATIETETPALSQLDSQFGRLFHTRDFQEGRDADAQGRPPVFTGQ
jgi:enoyl-CoA hydratase